MSRAPTFRQSAGLLVAAAAVEAVLSAATPSDAHRLRLIDRVAPPSLPSLAHLLALLVGLALLVLVPNIWRGTRRAASLAIAGLTVLAVLHVMKGLDYDEATLDLCLVALLLFGRRAFALGCRDRPSLAAVCAAIGAWALTYCALLIGPLVADRGHTIRKAMHVAFAHRHLSSAWTVVVEVLIVLAVIVSLAALRSMLRPAVASSGHTDDEYRTARAIVERYGEDSLSPFMLRPDKAFHFFADGVLAYRVIGETAVVSADPVAPGDQQPAVLASFRDEARRKGWEVVVWGASAGCLEAYRTLGMQALCMGEEAVVHPAEFTLEGRAVRKLRQSVNRIARRGWSVDARDGRDIDAALEAEIDRLEETWRAGRRRIIGFAMGMGAFDPDRRPSDLYLLGRSPEGDLRAVMRFVEHCGNVSLDSMHRIGQTPNGLNEALVCHALETARERGVSEVSLNYAGLAHVIRDGQAGKRLPRLLARTCSRLLVRRFQMARLVRFDEKFNPEWRRRFLVYESATQLALAGLRVLQAEGYLPQARPLRLKRRRRPTRSALPRSPQTDVAR